MNRLLDIGFEPAGHWLLKSEVLVFELLRHTTQRNILYAFVSDGQIKYVGKTTQSLFSRMAGYRRPSRSQVTNFKNHERIKALLRTAATVDILALPDNGLHHYGQFHLNLAAGLEDDIIRIIDPEWNGKERDQEGESTDDNVDAKPLPICIFSMILQPTYFKMGFFNVGVANAESLGVDGQTIEIFCGTAEQPIQGVINRTANTNGTPRIMGGTGLRDWFKVNIAQMQEIAIAVMSPTAIKIEAGKASRKVQSTTLNAIDHGG